MKEFGIIATAGESELRKLIHLRQELESVDVLEVRLDLCSPSFLSLEILKSLQAWKKQLLFTYRHPEDSSENKKSKIKYERVSYLFDIYNNKNNFLDIDLKFGSGIFDKIQNCNYSIIYSFHNFQRILKKEEMFELIQLAQEKKYDGNKYYKFAVMPNSNEEAIQFLESSKELSQNYPLILIAMGKEGVVSRIYPEKFGSKFTYCCIEEPRAPGQVKASELESIRKNFNGFFPSPNS
ncbi:MAG: type I 3-dehydroquinate dehydratase [Leptospiraceae bacterium]|nr:type I 3-dehydroquinate dehydratase [Leptospiraceae bacterium]